MHNLNESHGLRANSIKWLAQALGQLQRQVIQLERENAKLRDDLKALTKANNTAKAIAKAIGR